MEKIFVKKTREWAFWELASVATAESQQALLPCSECDDASIEAGHAMHGGWVRIVGVGAAEPKTESEATGRGVYLCPACQMVIGIDIEESYAKRPKPPQQQQRQRGGRGRPRRSGGGNNRSRRSSQSGDARRK